MKFAFLISSMGAILSAQSISITSPTASQAISGTSFILTASVSGVPSLASVEYDVNGEIACVSSAAPWSCTWNTFYTFGGATLVTAIARDTLNSTVAASAPVSFTVSNALPEPTASALTWNVSAPASPWAGPTTVSATISGSQSGNNKQCLTFVDGKFVNSPGFNTNATSCQLGSPNVTLDTRQFNNGIRNVVFVLQDNNSPINGIGWNAVQMWEQQIDFENGAAAMELRLRPGYEHFLCTTSLTNCPTSVAITGKVFKTDESSSAASFTSVTVTDTTVATASACSPCSSVTITQVGVGSTQVTFVESGGRTRKAWIHVNTANLLPHYGTDGSILTAYDPAKSFYTHAIFLNCPNNFNDGFYPHAFSYGQDFVNGGFNTAECGIWVQVQNSDTQAGWQNKQSNYVNSIVSLLQPLGLYWNAVDGGFMNGTPPVYITTRGPGGQGTSWTKPAVQYVFESLTNQRVISAQMTDETNAVWGGIPLPGLLTWGNSLMPSSFSCASSTCTINLASDAIQGGNSNFLILGATTNTCLNSDPVTGSVLNATSKTLNQFKFATSCGNITVNSASDPNLRIEPFVAWWTTPALAGAQCSSNCSDYVHYDAFAQFNAWANAAVGRPARCWPVQSNYDALTVMNWMSPPMSDCSVMYYSGPVFYIPQFASLYSAIGPNSSPSFVFRDKYRSLTAAARLAPITGEASGENINYGWEGYSVPIISITNETVTFAAPHRIQTVQPWNTRLWIDGSTDSSGSYAGKNFYIEDCPSATTCRIVSSKASFTASVLANQLVTAHFQDGTTVPVFALTADSTSIYGTSFTINNENNTCTTHHTPNHRGQTVTFTGTDAGGGSIGQWANNTFYYIPFPLNPGCSGIQQDGGLLGQIPNGASTGGTATIVLNQEYTRGQNYIGQNSENGPRVAFAFMTEQMILGSAGDREYLTQLYLDDPRTHLGPATFRDTSSQPVNGQSGLHPRYQYGRAPIMWQANSVAAKLISRLVKFEFQQRVAGPDYGQFIESTLRTGSYGNMLAMQSFADGTITRTVDLSACAIAGQPIIKYAASWRNIVVSTIGAGVTTDSAVFDPDNSSFIAYVCSVNAASEYSPAALAVRLADIPNAVKVAVQYGYTTLLFSSPVVTVQALPQAFDCGSGSCTLPVDRNIGTVYYRLVYLDTNSHILATSDIQTL